MGNSLGTEPGEKKENLLERLLLCGLIVTGFGVIMPHVSTRTNVISGLLAAGFFAAVVLARATRKRDTNKGGVS